jgi:hypothetical protein
LFINKYLLCLLKFKKIIMSKNSQFIFTVLQIIAWIIFVGLCIEAGGLIINFLFSVFKPEFVGNLYQKLDLRNVYLQSKWVFFGMYSFIIAIALLKAHLFYLVITLLLKFDLAKPFNSFVSDKIKSFAYYTFSIGIISHIASEVNKNVQKHSYELEKLNDFWNDSQAFLLMSAVIYIISVIITKGVEIQNENDLTV